MTIAAADVRNYITLNTDSTSRYSDATINSNIATGQYFLRKATQRYFESTSVTLTLTTEGEAKVDLPGIRSVTSVTQAGSTLTADETYWLIPDDQQSGVYTAIQLRAFEPRADGPWYLSVPQWFDRNLDSQLAALRGSLPNDLVIVGTAGYLDANLPAPYLNALKVMAAWLTLRPHAMLTGAAQSPDGLPFALEELPTEVQLFIRGWRVGDHSAVSV